MSQVEIGRVVKPHGIRGEVGVLMHQPESDLIEHVTELTVQIAHSGARRISIERAAKMGQGYRVKFVGVDDRNAAEQLRDATLSVSREVLPQLADDEDYLIDLVGTDVVGPDGAPYGIVVDVLTYPSVDAIVIERSDGSRVEQPLVQEWVEIAHDQEARPRVQLRSFEGLL